MAGRVKQSAISAWEYEIVAIDDEPITVNKLACGVVLMCIGFFLSRMLASLAAIRVLPKLGVSHAAASALRAVIFYCLLAAFR